jgi:anti-anti-sigma factor
MRAKVTRKDNLAIVSYEGDTIGLMPGPLPEVLSALQQGGVQEVILDLSKLKFLNPNGIKAIRESYEAAKKHEASFGIASPQPGVRRALKLSGIGQDVPIYYNEREAVANLDLVTYQETAKAELTDRLLICQKDLPIAGALRAALKKHPLKPQFRMIPVRDLKHAMRVLLEEKIDCILIESTFPLYQVSSFIEQVETDERIPSIPIVVVSTDEHLDEADLIIRNGAQDILRYPFQTIEVMVRLQTMISHLKDHRPFTPPAKIVQPRGWR